MRSQARSLGKNTNIKIPSCTTNSFLSMLNKGSRDYIKN